MQRGQLPSPLGLFRQPLCSWWSIPADRSLPPPVVFLASVFPSVPSAAPSEQVWYWSRAAQAGCDFCTGISGDSYIQLISIPTGALIGSAAQNCSSYQLCYF